MLEQLYESLVNITLQYCFSSPGHFSVLYDILLRAVEHFPNNATFFNAISNCDVSILYFLISTFVIFAYCRVL